MEKCLGEKSKARKLIDFGVIFWFDKDSTSEKLSFNRTVTLRDSYKKDGIQAIASVRHIEVRLKLHHAHKWRSMGTSSTFLKCHNSSVFHNVPPNS
ncbi:hypothetical protein Leryth_005863 [Lithospermum erythrorhizon]|nr:hypothetical protein Leryth_005863 [Lithospermum erythrorhizon]